MLMKNNADDGSRKSGGMLNTIASALFKYDGNTLLNIKNSIAKKRR